MFQETDAMADTIFEETEEDIPLDLYGDHLVPDPIDPLHHADDETVAAFEGGYDAMHETGEWPIMTWIRAEVRKDMGLTAEDADEIETVLNVLTPVCEPARVEFINDLIDIAGGVVLTDEQSRGIEFIATSDAKVRKLHGPAGSGKSTLIVPLLARLRKAGHYNIVLAAMTNKAANVLTNKGALACSFHAACMRPIFKQPWGRVANILDGIEGLEAELKDPLEELLKLKDAVEYFGEKKLKLALGKAREYNMYAGLHILGVNSMMDIVEGWAPVAQKPGHTLIVDEASMLGADDLEKACKVYDHVICIGDENQLPPVKAERVFGGIEEAFRLTEIHRHKEMAQPLVLAHKLLKEGHLDLPDPVPIKLQDCIAGVPIIVWTNKTREALVRQVRDLRGFSGLGPQVGEIIVCRVNDRKKPQLTNNSFWRVTWSDMNLVDIENIDSGDKIEKLPVFMEDVGIGSGTIFRYAYAVVCHCAQGSEFSRIMISYYDAKRMRECSGDYSKWLYTALTRAKIEVVFVTNGIER